MVNEVSRRKPSLDGLRATSILMVLYDHAFRPQLIHIGTLGVLIFFIISSYLIVGILIRDVEMNRFSVKSFYFKRLMRIVPAFYFYLLILAIVLILLSIFDWSKFWQAPLFLVNYMPRSDWAFPQWFVGHTWSLAVEEQFYILVAMLFYFFNKKKFDKQKLCYILIIIFIIVPIIRIGYMYCDFIPNILKGSRNRSFETVADSLAIGGIIALTEKYIINNRWFIFFKNKTIFLFISILILMTFNSSSYVILYGLKIRYVYNLFGLTIINIFVGIIMLVYIVYSKENKIAMMLNNKVVVKIGLWSFSIYLWQQLWLYSWNFSIYFKFLGIIGCSIFSYYCIELPFLKIRDNYLTKKSNERP